MNEIHMSSYAFVGFILIVIAKCSFGPRFSALISEEINGERVAKRASVIYISQYGASQRQNTDLDVRNQNADHMALLPETGTVVSPRTVGS
jgi:hypothetical protein